MISCDRTIRLAWASEWLCTRFPNHVAKPGAEMLQVQRFSGWSRESKSSIGCCAETPPMAHPQVALRRGRGKNCAETAFHDPLCHSPLSFSGSLLHHCLLSSSGIVEFSSPHELFPGTVGQKKRDAKVLRAIKRLIKHNSDKIPTEETDGMAPSQTHL